MVTLKHQRDPQTQTKEWHYLKIPFISEQLNRKITVIFKRENISVRIAHKSYTLRQALSHNTTERKCNRPNCPIADTNLCLQRNTVYQLMCEACGEYYIRSTTRFLHDQTKEHLASDNSSVKEHLTTHHRNNSHNIEVKVITRDLTLTSSICDYTKCITSENTSRDWTPVRNALNLTIFYFNQLF